MAKLFGESISEEVVNQLTAREEVYAAPGGRNPQQLRYLHEKTAWVRAISGINRRDPETQEYSSKMAKEFILSGGKLTWNSETKKFEPRSSAINFSNNESGRYSFTDNLGIRPEPGITSFSITHKNRFGTIREASLSFVVWTRDDLLKAERLYLRPGAQVVVEWGNSVYIDNEGTVDNIPLSDQYNEFFNSVYVEKIYEIINKVKKDSYYNYDGFLGLVTNFTWRYRTDGGYDCSITIVSRSAVLESLTLLKPLDEAKTDDYFTSSQKTSLLHYFISVCNQKKIEDIAPDEEVVSDKNFLNLTDLENIEILEKTLQTFTNPRGYTSTSTVTTSQTVQTNLKNLLGTVNKDYIYTDGQENFLDSLKVYGFDNAIDSSNKEEVKFRYISLRYFLALVNKAFVFPRTKDTDFPSFYLGQKIKEKLLPENLNAGIQTYKTFDQHVSLDPFVAILPKKAVFTDKEKEKIFFVKKDYSQRTNKYDLPDEELINPFQIVINKVSDSIQEQDSLDILDIHINLNRVKEILDSYISSENEPVKINVLDLVKKVLADLNAAFGNINSFDIDFNEDLQKYYIIDREIVNEQLADIPKDSKENRVKLLNVLGLKNTVSDISIESKISSELSSMIAISNQAPIADEGNASQPLIDWNAGTKNRFINADQSGVVENTYEEVFVQQWRDYETTGLYEAPSAEEPTNYVELNPPAKTPEQVEKGNKLKEAQNKETEKRIKFYRELGEAYVKLNNLESGFLSRKEYKSKFFDRAKGEGNLVFQKRLTTFNKNKRIADQGLIPLQLSLTLDGISGFKIGQVFKIGSKSSPSYILPDVYDSYGFIVTGVDSNVGTDGKWTTTLRAQTFRLD